MLDGGESGQTLATAEVPPIPFGYIRDWMTCVPNTAYASHGWIATVKREIFDGNKFVDFDSSDGTRVLNDLFQRTGRAA